MTTMAHPQKDRRTASRSASAVYFYAVLLIFLYDSLDVSNDFYLMANSPLWVVRPLAWACLFALLGRVLQDKASATAWKAWVLMILAWGFVPIVLTTVLSAMVLGPLQTTTALGIYFRDRALYGYFGNVVGWPHFILPGIFDDANIAQCVNATMWAVPCALIAVATAAAIKWQSALSPILPALVAVVATGIAVLVNTRGIALLSSAGLLRSEGVGLPLICVFSAMSGMVAGPYLRRGLFDIRIAIGVGMAIVILALISARDMLGNPAICLLIVFSAIYAVEASSVFRLTLNRQVAGLAPSLGMFLLVSYPIQQTTISLFGAHQSPLITVVVALPTTAMIAYFAMRSMIVLESRLVGQADTAELYAAADLTSVGSALRAIAGARGPVALVVVVTAIVLLVFFMTLLAFEPPKIGI